METSREPTAMIRLKCGGGGYLKIVLYAISFEHYKRKVSANCLTHFLENTILLVLHEKSL